MNTDHIRWQSFERGDLPKALFGKARTSVSHSLQMEYALQVGQGIALGYSESDHQTEYSPPDVIVLDDYAAPETLSWLKTFAPETSPLSQFSRVILRSDWERFGGRRPWEIRRTAHEDRWACLILGELLAQGDSGIEIASLPLSWSASCFSTTAARSAILHPFAEAQHTCLERLLVLEKDQKFVRRQVTVTALEPLWDSAVLNLEKEFEVPEVADLVTRLAERSTGIDLPLSRSLDALFSRKGDFMSDSFESRVVAFQKLFGMIGELVGDRPPNSVEQALVAAGAFLVGRGSSHRFLLGRLPRRWSQAFIWFGLMTGLAGAQTWDAEWSRAVKGIERLLRTRFDWCAASGADLSWPEYYWLSTTFTGKDMFADFPKLLPKVLAVEIVPGATCQLRLVADSAGFTRETTQREKHDSERRGRDLRNTMDEIARLVIRARQLMAGQEGQEIIDQGSLEFDDQRERDSSSSRSRRGKRQ